MDPLHGDVSTEILAVNKQGSEGGQRGAVQRGREALLLQQLIVLRVKTTHAQATVDWHWNNKQIRISCHEGLHNLHCQSVEKTRARLQPKRVQVSACRPRDRNNRNRRVAPAALQIRAALNEDLGLFKLPHKRVPATNSANNIQLF